MKRMKLIVFSLAMVALSAQSLFALDISLGASGWYNMWRPAWHEGIWRMTYYNPPATTVLLYHVRGPRFSTEGDFFGGPSLSVRFLERWKVSTAFIYGQFSYGSQGQSMFVSKLLTAAPTVSGGLQHYHRTVTRYDSDTSVSFAVTDWFGLLLGFKLQGYSYRDFIFLVANPVRSKYTMMNYGPALGFGVTLHIFEGLFFLCNVNGVFMTGHDDAKFQYGIAFLLPNRGSFYSYGGTAQGSLAYIFSSINTTVSLGFRCQMLYYHQRSIAFLEFGGKYDIIYGVTLSAVYTFHLTR